MPPAQPHSPPPACHSRAAGPSAPRHSPRCLLAERASVFKAAPDCGAVATRPSFSCCSHRPVPATPHFKGATTRISQPHQYGARFTPKHIPILSPKAAESPPPTPPHTPPFLFSVTPRLFLFSVFSLAPVPAGPSAARQPGGDPPRGLQRGALLPKEGPGGGGGALHRPARVQDFLHWLHGHREGMWFVLVFSLYNA